MKKPAAVKLLEARGVPHRLVRFDPAIRSAEGVAAATEVEPERVFKTLVVEEEPPRGRPYLVMVRGSAELDLRRLAAQLGVKRLRMAAPADAERLTGLKLGGISALALTGRSFRVLLDASAMAHETVLVSAGERGADVELRPGDLAALTGARLVEV
ncbi:MAG: Cys-tRNA(Pro)/Cys-tRNA(Cys) deacylase [Tepidiforma sp.]|nr:YbaK/EbsC family protein [Tepidiforma sp.]GIW17337.1 MAG: Cys-tRNA(Pro)/Cys-tRNA(Cys) deacylase [Tepidiforma sp.]